jgi:anti-anti-sigma regulatory factor
MHAAPGNMPAHAPQPPTEAAAVSTHVQRALAASASQPPVVPRLQSLHLELISNPLLLADTVRALSAFTHLISLHVGVTPQALTLPMSDSLKRLRSLKDLGIFVYQPVDNDQVIPACCLKALKDLSDLSYLCLGGIVESTALQYLPCRLTALAAWRVGTSFSTHNASQVVLDLQHLSRLQHLGVGSLSSKIASCSLLPSGLSSLKVAAPIGAVTGLSHLHALSLSCAESSLELLQQLHRLNELRALTVKLCGCTDRRMHDVLASIGAATKLTELILYAYSIEGPLPVEYALPMQGALVSEHLSKLQSLQTLWLLELEMQPGDALGLRALTGLTTLNVRGVPYFGSLAVAALACAAKHLQELALVECGADDIVFLPVVATQTELRSLEFSRGPVMSDATLQLLVPLTNLTYLAFLPGHLPGPMQRHDSSLEAQQRFLAAMPQLSTIRFDQ